MKRTTNGIIVGLANALAYVKDDQSRGKAHVVKLDDVQTWEQGSGWPKEPARG